MASTKYTYKDYTESEKVKDAQAALENHNATKPGEYTSQWTGQINDTLNKIQNRGPFSYDLASDALYQQYADRYAQLGKMAMQDTVGQAAALTGGYGNSYAVTAGNQAYQKYLQGINDIVPELQQMAYERYNQEGQNLLNLYGLYSDRENTDYSRWQNTLTNWENERAYLSDYYNNERTYDRGVYEGDRAFDYGKWTDDRNYNYQIERDKVTDEQWQKQFDEDKRQFNLNYNLQKSKSSGAGSSGSDSADGKTPTAKMYDEALNAYMRGGETALNQYAEKYPEYNYELMFDYATNHWSGVDSVLGVDVSNKKGQTVTIAGQTYYIPKY